MTNDQQDTSFKSFSKVIIIITVIAIVFGIWRGCNHDTFGVQISSVFVVINIISLFVLK